MAKRGDAPIFIGTYAQPLDRRMPVRRVIRHQRPLKRNLHGSFGLFGGQRCDHSIGTDEQLSAEPPAHIRRIEANIFGVDAQNLAHALLAPVDHLVGGPKGQLIAIPRCDRGMRLHHRMAFVRRCICRVDLYFGCGERAVEVSKRLAIGLSVFTLRKRGIRREFRKIETSSRPVIGCADESGGGSCLLERLCYHACNCLVIMRNVTSTKQRGVVRHAFSDGFGFRRKHNGNYTRCRARIPCIHRGNPALGNGRADNVAICLIRHHIVPFIGIGRLPRRLERAVDTWRRFADHFGLVEQIITSRSIEFHGA